MPAPAATIAQPLPLERPALCDYRLPDLTKLPGWVLNFAEVMPVPDAFKLAQACPMFEREEMCSKSRKRYRYRSSWPYIPRSTEKADHWVVRALGKEHAQTVMSEAGGVHAHFATRRKLLAAPRLRWAMDLAAYGWSREAIAATIGITSKYSENVICAYGMWREGSAIEAVALASKISTRLLTLVLAYDWLRPIHTPAMIGKIGPPRLPTATPCHNKQEQDDASRRRYSLDMLELGFMPDVAGERAGLSVFEVLRLCQAASAWRSGASLRDAARLAGLSEERAAWMLSRKW